MSWRYVLAGLGLVSTVLYIALGVGAALSGLFSALAIMLVSYMLYPREADLEIDVQTDVRRVYVGDEGTVTVVLENRGGEELHVRYSIETGSAEILEGQAEGSAVLPPNSRRAVRLRLRFSRRGGYDLGPIVAQVSDPLNISSRRVERFYRDVVSVFPRYSPPTMMEGRASYSGVWPGSIKSRFRGHSLEFYEVREYQPGDELRRINWKATARLGRLMTNEYESERVTDSLIIVDVNGLGGTPYESRIMDVAVSGAATIAASLLRQGNRVGLLTMGGRRIWLRPGFGRQHFMKILYALSEVRPGESLRLEHVTPFLVPRILKPGAQIYIVSALMDETLRASIENMVAKGYSVVVVGVLPRATVNDEGWLLTSRIIDAEHKVLLAEIRRLCPIVLWDGEVRLTSLISRALKKYRGVGVAHK